LLAQWGVTDTTSRSRKRHCLQQPALRRVGQSSLAPCSLTMPLASKPQHGWPPRETPVRACEHRSPQCETWLAHGSRQAAATTPYPAAVGNSSRSRGPRLDRSSDTTICQDVGTWCSSRARGRGCSIRQRSREAQLGASPAPECRRRTCVAGLETAVAKHFPETTR
jgi:hypothetical protein